MVTRSQGYINARGKEQPALDMVSAFFAHRVGIDLTGITDKDENYLYGDFRSPAGNTLEVKGQPIDPVRYPQNFVEICEFTTNPLHRNGFERLYRLLDIHPDDLAECRIWNATTKSWEQFGIPECVSVSIQSIYASRATAYVNASADMAHLYIYGRNELVNHLRPAVLEGSVRGAGNCNEDGVGVKVPLPLMRWSSPEGGGWQYTGEHDEAWALTKLCDVFSPIEEIHD